MNEDEKKKRAERLKHPDFAKYSGWPPPAGARPAEPKPARQEKRRKAPDPVPEPEPQEGEDASE